MNFNLKNIGLAITKVPKYSSRDWIDIVLYATKKPTYFLATKRAEPNAKSISCQLACLLQDVYCMIERKVKYRDKLKRLEIIE